MTMGHGRLFARPAKFGRGQRNRIVGLLGMWLVLSVAGTVLYGPPVHTQVPEEATDVEVVREHMFFTRGPGGVQVLHMMELVNAGPRVATAVPLTVPEGARWLEVPDELVAEQDGAVDPRPLAMGEGRRYVMVYEIPWQRLPMPIRRPLLYPTEQLLLWAEADELELRGVNVHSVGREQIGDTEFDVYFMAELQPHPAWHIVLDSSASRAARLPSLAPAGHRSDPVDILRSHPLPRLLLGVVLVSAVVGMVRRTVSGRFTWGRWRARENGGTSDSPRVGASSAIREGPGANGEIARLKEEIVRVDVAFDSGELDEDVYAERRDQLKQRLLTLMSQQTKQSGTGGERP